MIPKLPLLINVSFAYFKGIINYLLLIITKIHYIDKTFVAKANN